MKVFKKLSMCILSGLLCFGVGVTTQAAEKIGKGVYALETSVYSDVTKDTFSADVTNDGKKDIIETVLSSVKEKVTLKVNGKTVKSWKAGTVNIHVVNVSKQAFLEITNWKSDLKLACGLYQIKKNKLTCIQDYTKLVNLKLYTSNCFTYKANCFDEFTATKVKGNTIYLHGEFATKNLGQLKADGFMLAYSGKKFTLKNNAVTACPGYFLNNNGNTMPFNAGTKIQTYKSAGSSKKAFVIKKNTKFNVKKIAVIKKNIYIQIKTPAGKTGWMKLNTSNKALVTNPPISIAG